MIVIMAELIAGPFDGGYLEIEEPLQILIIPMHPPRFKKIDGRYVGQYSYNYTLREDSFSTYDYLGVKCCRGLLPEGFQADASAPESTEEDSDEPQR